jgi:hypothetical protein
MCVCLSDLLVKANSPNFNPDIFEDIIVDKNQVPLKIHNFIFLSIKIVGITEFLILIFKPFFIKKRF